MQTTKGQATWIEYGEPVDGERVKATLTKRGKDIQGTISYKTVDLIEGHEYQGDDGALIMSYLDMDEFNKIMDDFEEENDKNNGSDLS